MEPKIRLLQIPAGKVTLDADLIVPEGAEGVVLFAHGSGSNRSSPRNRAVARQLRRQRLGTLLFDLLTAAENELDQNSGELRFDIEHLARRLVEVTDWVARDPQLHSMRVGYFGSSTGAAAALRAAVERPQSVAAVVSRGGRPDLAAAVLDRVIAPTLLIVGGEDAQVLPINQVALAKLAGTRELAVVFGATHLFYEPGALERVAELAGAWFERYLTAASVEERPSHAPP